MADINRLAQFLDGVVQGVSLASNTLVVLELKVGGDAGSVLTKAILDNLITLQNGSDIGASVHHHDGLYYRENELGSTTASSEGVTLIGDGRTYTNFTGGATLGATLTGLDSALATIGIKEFLDTEFRIQDDGDNTKKIAFQAAAISTATTRIITMPDSNIDLGDIALNTTHRSSNGSDHAYVNNLISLSGMSAGSVNLGSFTGATIPNDQNVKQALQALEVAVEANNSLIQNFEWQESVIDHLSTPPGTPASGDRYLVVATATGAWLGEENKIAEWNGSAWVFTAPTLGTYLSVDDENDGLYLYGGSSWDKKYFESTTASTGLTKVGFDIRLAEVAATNGIEVSAGGVISAAVDNSSLEINGSQQLQVKALGITNAMLAGSIEYAKLTIADGDLTIAKTSGLQTALNGKQAASANLDEADTFFGLTDITGAQAETLSDGSNADALHSHSQLIKVMVAGEEFTAGNYFVRIGADGKVFKADFDATTNKHYYAYGVVQPGSTIAVDANISVILIGEITLGSNFFETAEVGEPVHIKAAGAFDALSQITYNVSEASYRVGIVTAVNKILVGNMQLLGIN